MIENLQIKNSLDVYDGNYRIDRLSSQRLITGYPTIDKPWEQYYDFIEFEEQKLLRTIYQEIYANNKLYLSDKALEFFGSKISYKQLFKNIDKTAKSFEEYGIKKGDIVTICCAGIPEMVYSFYALSKIGAVANFMSPFFGKDGMMERINECESKLLIVMDKFYLEINDAIQNTCIENSIVVPTLNSSILRFVPSKKLDLDFSHELLWKNFIYDGRNREESKIVDYEYKLPLALVYSSGTTGAAKAILLSNDSFQNSVYAYEKSGIDLSRNQKFYQIIPPWFSTGLSTSIHLPLSHGSTVFMDPRFERDIFIRNIFKAKPNYTIAPTSMYEGFLDEKLVGNKSLYFFKYPFEGGEPLRKEVEESIESVFKKHGSDAKLRMGYGQCECGATIATQFHNDNQIDGSVGIPLPGIVIGIFDENYNELPYGSRGQILVNTQCGMTEYYKNPLATDEYFYIDNNGVKWSQTGDIGYMDENGNLFVEGRMSDYTVVNGKKIYNFDIEKILDSQFEIKTCDVIANNNDDMVAHIIFDDDYVHKFSSFDSLNEILQNYQRIIFEHFSDIDMVPELFKIREEFPYAKSGKRDILKMKDEVKDIIYIDKSNLIKSKNFVLKK